MTKKDFENKNIAILGFGTEGRDVFEYLKKFDCRITICDKKQESELNLDEVDLGDTALQLGRKYIDNLKSFDVIFRSPGVYRFLPEIVKAENQGVIVTSAIKYFLENCKAKTIGVTGTKGKGTTSTLIYEILKFKNNKNVHLVGNIGRPPLQLLDKLNKDSIVVLELSSFQLIDLEKSPNISVVLNITSDHMDWHKNQSEYVDAKKKIITNQGDGDFAVINADYETSKSFDHLDGGKKYYFSLKKQVEGVFVKDNIIYSNVIGGEKKIGTTEKLLLRGLHNQENICAAICASILAGASIKQIQKVVYSFNGLEHRLELVKKVKGVSFYNDSFSTNPQTVEAAVESFDEPMTLILGGFDKNLDYNRVFRIIASKENIKNILLIGDMRIKFKVLLKKYEFKGKIIDLEYSFMEEIVGVAFKSTPKGGVVVLSPGCSSFDMFESYKERGKQFKTEVENLV